MTSLIAQYYQTIPEDYLKVKNVQNYRKEVKYKKKMILCQSRMRFMDFKLSCLLICIIQVGKFPRNKRKIWYLSFFFVLFQKIWQNLIFWKISLSHKIRVLEHFFRYIKEFAIQKNKIKHSSFRCKNCQLEKYYLTKYVNKLKRKSLVIKKYAILKRFSSHHA